ncbi:uncharacterized protein LOC143920279 isoform X2 [Arctopsyche grandis]|uniref:uncharacterized protein LOC143920279 isoform X2 n=1 Tax=Arctopsyche grandis TaxID=121162 RepID=UPI00406D9E15
MLKHILATAPLNGTRIMAAQRDATASGDAPAEAPLKTEPPGNREFGNRVDGLGPRTDAKGDVRAELVYREPRSEYATREPHGGDVTPRETAPQKPPEPKSDSSRNRIDHHRSEYHSRDFRSDYRGDVTPRELAAKQDQFAHHRYQNTVNRRDANLSMNQSQLSVTAVQRLPQQQPLNVSTLNSSKHSLGGTSSSASPGGRLAPPQGKFPNGGLRVNVAGTGGGRALATLTPANLVPANVSRFMNRSKEAGIKEMLTSLGLLCLVSLLLALLSLIFLLKISPASASEVRELVRAEQMAVSIISADEYVVVYEVTLALCALTLSLNLCCLLVCAIQFLFAVKLVNSSAGIGGRTNKYLQKSAVTRVCAVGGFFISIPVFLTGIILYTFIQFHSTPAIVTSVFIGLGIIFCGCAMVHNVFVWQKEKTNAVKAMHSHNQNIGTPQSVSSLTGNGYLTSNGHISSPGNATLGTSMTFHNTTSSTAYNHLPITILPHQGPYIIRPPTSTPPTPGDLGGSTRPPRPPRPPASGSVSPPGVPPATLDLSHPHPDPHELSTLV